MKKYLRTREVAERLGVTRKTVWNMIQRGSFPSARKIDPGAKSVFVISESDVVAVEKKNEKPSP